MSPALKTCIALLLATGLAGCTFQIPASTSTPACPAAPRFAESALRDPLPATALKVGAFNAAPMARTAASRLDEALAQIAAKTGADGVTVAVMHPRLGLWSRTTAPAAGPARPVFWWASVGKAFTATVIRQMVAEGKVSLTDPLSRWHPDLANAQAITLDQLLRHTSGLYSFQQDESFRARKGYVPPGQLLAIALSRPLDFCPGSKWSYSNTGYVLLAQIAEAIDGKPYDRIVADRLIAPLGLTTTRILRPDERPRSLAVPTPYGDGFSPSTPFGAGAVISGAEDMARFWHAVLAGRFESAASLRTAFSELHPMFGQPMAYGQGVMVTDVPDPQRPSTWLSHAGGTEDMSALVAYDTRSGTIVAVAFNSKISAEATANALLKALDAEP